MKAIWTIIMTLLVINALAILGVVGWLYQDGRLNQGRIDKVRDIFELTIEEETLEKQQAQELAEKTRQQALEVARLESVSDGPVTLADRLVAEQQGDELAIQRVERLGREIQDLRRQLRLAKQLLTKQEEELATQRQAFEQAIEKQIKLQENQDFQQAVRMYQQVKPKQAKQMFQRLIQQGKQSQVVEYLAAMQLRKAAGVLKQFKSPQEIAQATDLLQQLRERGIPMELDGLGGPEGL